LNKSSLSFQAAILFVSVVKLISDDFFSAHAKLSFKKAEIVQNDVDYILEKLNSKYPDLIKKISKPSKKPFSSLFWNSISNSNGNN